MLASQIYVKADQNARVRGKLVSIERRTNIKDSFVNPGYLGIS